MKIDELLKPPSHLDAEQAILGAILLDNVAYWTIQGTLTSEMFYRPAHARIFEAVADLAATRAPIDLVTLSDELANRGLLDEIGGTSALVDIMGSVATTGGIRAHAELVRGSYFRRMAILAGQRLQDAAHSSETSIEETVSRCTEIMLTLGCWRSRSDIRPLSALIVPALEEIDRATNFPDQLTGVPTGLSSLDRITGGLAPQWFVTVAGRSSSGKSCLSLMMLLAAAAAGKKVGLISLEMGAVETAMRTLAMQAKLSFYRMRRGQVSPGEWTALARAASVLSALPFCFVEEGDRSMREIAELARKMQIQHGLDLLCIDNFNNLKGSHDYQKMSENSRQGKMLAKELGIPVLGLFQLNRRTDERENKRPMVADLKQSGAIEENSDVILLLYRSSLYSKDPLDTHAELDIAKHRNGPLGTITLEWDKMTMRYREPLVESTV